MKLSNKFLAILMVFSILFFPVTLMASGHGGAPTGFFTAETLAEFDGLEDTPAYISYHGRILL